MQMDNSSAKQRKQSPRNASTRERNESKVKAHETELKRTIKDLEKTVENLKSLLVEKDEEIRSESPAPYVVVRGVGSASSLRSMSRASSASYESVHGFGSTSTLKSEAEQALQLLDELYKQAAAVIEKIDTSTIAETTKGGKGKGKLPIKLELHQVSDKFKSVSSVLTEMGEAIMEIRRLQAVNQYLRAALDGIHTTIIDGDKTILETPKSMKGDQSILEVEAKIKEVTQKVHEIKTEAEYVVCLLEELTKFSHLTEHGENSYVFSHPQNVETSLHFKTKDEKNIETSRENLSQIIYIHKRMKHYINASLVLQKMKEIDNLRKDLGEKTEQVEDLRKRLQKMQDDNTKMKNEADSLRTRLSEHAGALLTYDNPSIADLRDPNRPTKLSEKYSDLYDIQWTDAYSNISKKDPSISEDKMISYLYEMLVDGYRFCQDVRQKQKSGLEDLLFYPAGRMNSSQRGQKRDIGKIFAENLNDVTKFSSNETSASMAEAFVEDKRTKDKYGEKIKLCDNYIRECVQLCWHMQVQTPPLYLDLKTIQGQAFDKNCYREYTKKGKKIAFVVWPAIFLYENGPLLHKGVAQGQ